MELTEKVDLRAINFLSSLSFGKFKEYILWDCNVEEKRKMYDNFQTFCKLNIKSKGEVRRLYSYTLKTPNDVGGRLFSGSSIQGLPKDVRGAIMKHTTDIDMKNAHPTILRYLCKLHNIPCPNLHYFCDNRDEAFNSIGNDKEYAKKLFLKSVNNDKLDRKEKNSFFKAFDKECKTIQQQITGIIDYKHIVDCVPISKVYNWYGSAINRILCSYENKILQEMISVLNHSGIEIAVLMFDGLMVYGDFYNNSELLQNIETAINEKFINLNMKLSYKEHSNEIRIPEDYEIPTQNEVAEKIEINSFETMVAEFEKTHCKILNTSSFIKEYENKTLCMNRTQLKTSYEHLHYEILKFNKDGDPCIEKKSFIDDWLRFPKIRHYVNIGIYPPPLLCPETVYNLWRPFDMEFVETYETKDAELNKMLNHIKILCGNDDIVYDYFVKWIGQMIKCPATKTICPTLISNEGAGKGTLMRLLEKMLGCDKVYETTKPSRDVWGDFNGRMANTFLVNFNELGKKETLESMNYIKGLITDPKITINNKGVSQYDIQSYHRFIITTNNEEPISTTKDDRRKLIIRSSDELIGNKEYFDDMYKILEDMNVVKTCYEYFKNIEGLDKFLSIPMPKTEYQEDLKEMSVNPIESWIKDFVTQNAGNGEEVVSLQSKETYAEFKDWVKQNGIHYELNNIQFAVRLKRLNIKGIEVKKTKTCNVTLFNISELTSLFS